MWGFRGNSLLFIGASTGLLLSAGSGAAQNTADATLVFTVTLDDVVLIDTTDGSELLLSETPGSEFAFSEIFDEEEFDFGPNGLTFSGGSPLNPAGAVGTGSSSEVVLFDGQDPFADDFDPSTFAIGDSIVTTLSASASAITPGSVFFGQVDSANTLSFSPQLLDNEALRLEFSFQADLSGTVDATFAEGAALVFIDGEEEVLASQTLDDPSEVTVAEDFFGLFSVFSDSLVSPTVFDDTTEGSFEVEFAADAFDQSITFVSGLTVNAEVTVPEPGALVLIGAGALGLVGRRRVA